MDLYTVIQQLMLIFRKLTAEVTLREKVNVNMGLILTE